MDLDFRNKPKILIRKPERRELERPRLENRSNITAVCYEIVHKAVGLIRLVQNEIQRRTF
jgi:hypothetical protein